MTLAKRRPEPTGKPQQAACGFPEQGNRPVLAVLPIAPFPSGFRLAPLDETINELQSAAVVAHGGTSDWPFRDCRARHPVALASSRPVDAAPSYATRTDYKSGAVVPLVLDELTVTSVAVDLLG